MKKGFTLIELIIIIAVLGLLAIFTYPKITSVIENSKIKARERTIETLKESLNNYLITNGDTPNDQTVFDIQILVDKEYLKDKDIIDPVTNEKMNGCLYYRWDFIYNQYVIEYKDTCDE